MFNPNRLCAQFWIKVGALKIVGCGFGGACLNLPKLGVRGHWILVPRKFLETLNSGRVSERLAGWDGRESSSGNLASGCLGGGDARRLERRTRFFLPL